MNNTELTFEQLSEFAGGAPHNTDWVGTRVTNLSGMNEKQVKGFSCEDLFPLKGSLKPVAFSPSVVGR